MPSRVAFISSSGSNFSNIIGASSKPIVFSPTLKPIDLKKTYIVSSWGGNLQSAGANLQKEKTRAVYDVTRDYIKRQKVVDVSNKGNVTIVDYSCGCPEKGTRGK